MPSGFRVQGFRRYTLVQIRNPSVAQAGSRVHARVMAPELYGSYHGLPYYHAPTPPDTNPPKVSLSLGSFREPKGVVQGVVGETVSHPLTVITPIT